jgi:CheY-like chemotaxis protein
MQTVTNHRRVRVLHLEDSEYDWLLVASMLKESDLHCEIKVVQSEAAFAASLKEIPYDLIISDYSLPSYDGWKALELAKELHPEIPFIFFSGTMGEERAIESLKKGAIDYVLKQRPNRLVPAVHQALQFAEKQALLRGAEQKKIASKSNCWTRPATPSWFAIWTTGSFSGTKARSGFTAGAGRRRWDGMQINCSSRNRSPKLKKSVKVWSDAVSGLGKWRM